MSSPNSPLASTRPRGAPARHRLSLRLSNFAIHQAWKSIDTDDSGEAEILRVPHPPCLSIPTMPEHPHHA